MFHSFISKYFRKEKIHTHLEKKEIVRLSARADRTLPSDPCYIETLYRAQKLQGDTNTFKTNLNIVWSPNKLTKNIDECIFDLLHNIIIAFL